MSPGDTLERMRRNPKGDWTMADVQKACAERGARCRPPPGGGSHFKVSRPARADILTVPARRPIRPVYIRKLVAYLTEDE